MQCKSFCWSRSTYIFDKLYKAESRVMRLKRLSPSARCRGHSASQISVSSPRNLSCRLSSLVRAGASRDFLYRWCFKKSHVVRRKLQDKPGKYIRMAKAARRKGLQLLESGLRIREYREILGVLALLYCNKMSRLMPAPRSFQSKALAYLAHGTLTICNDVRGPNGVNGYLW